MDLLSVRTPASFVAFDILALDDLDLRPLPLSARRDTLVQLLGEVQAPIHLTPASKDPAIAQDWFERFEGSGFDGVMAKPLDGAYVEDKRVQFKVKHHRTADCVVAGYRVHKEGGVGSLLLGLFDEGGSDGSPPRLHHVGVCSAFAASRRRTLLGELSVFEDRALEGHPWLDELAAVAAGERDGTVRLPGGVSRWSAGKDADWVPVRCELVAEVTYENVTAGRFRHPARFVRWRPDKSPVGVHLRPGRPTSAAGVRRDLRRGRHLSRPQSSLRRLGLTRRPSPGILGKLGGQGASPSPASSS